MIRSRVYRNGNLEAADFDLARISDLLAEEGTVVWVDLCEPEAPELQTLAAEVGLNPLAVEDAVKGRQRPKVDRYDDHLFLTSYDVRLDSDSGSISLSELGIFVSPRYLLTVRRDPAFDIHRVLAAWDSSADLAKYGVAFLLYGLLDVVVDGHFEATEELDDAIDGLEDLLFDDQPHGRDVQVRSYQLRKSLVELRRVVLPMREVLSTLMRAEFQLADGPMRPYYQDVQDHVLRVTEQADSLRDLVATIFETHLTMQGNRLNEIMKKVTSYAALFAVPTAVSGYYGMNVRIFPGAGTTRGGILALVLMVGLSLWLYLVFKRRNWL